jgi:hypothetical protein
MTGEKLLLVDVPQPIAAALAEAGIPAVDDLAPEAASVALVGRAAAIAPLRAAAPALPILALTDATDADAIAPPGHEATAVRAWLASGMVAALERLAAVFGRESMVSMAGGLAALLDESDPDAMRAHRIAGLAGTLGLVALNRSWLAVSEGDRTALPSAMRAASRASEAIGLFTAG